MASSSAPGTSLDSSGSPEKFFFYMGRIVTTALPSPAPRLHTDDCFEIHNLHWELCDLLYSIQQNVPLWTRLYHHVFCKKPLLFSSSSRDHNLGPSESAYLHCAHPNLVSLLLAAPLVIHEKNWKCLDPLAQGFPVALKDYFHRPNSLWTPVVTSAIHAMHRFVLLRVLHFFLFSVSVGLCCRFHRNSSLVLALLSCTGFSVYMLTSNTESRDEDDGEVGEGVVEEGLADKPGTTNGTQFDILQSILLPFLWRLMGEMISRNCITTFPMSPMILCLHSLHLLWWLPLCERDDCRLCVALQCYFTIGEQIDELRHSVI